MNSSTSVFLVDVDNVLINRDSASKYIATRFEELSSGAITSEIYWNTYNTVVTENQGKVDVPQIAHQLALVGNIKEDVASGVYFTIPFQNYLIDGALGLLRKCKDHGRTLVFTQGDPNKEGYQWYKVRSSGISDMVGEQNIHIFEDKLQAIERFFSNLRRDGARDITSTLFREDFGVRGEIAYG